MKIGGFWGPVGSGIPEPERTWTLPGGAPSLDQVVVECGRPDEGLHWWIGSVNRPYDIAVDRLVGQASTRRHDNLAGIGGSAAGSRVAATRHGGNRPFVGGGCSEPGP